MSNIIRCDKCKKDMYEDSRSERDAYCSIRIEYTDGYSSLHFCKSCLRQFRTEFIRDYTPEEFDDVYGKAE